MMTLPEEITKGMTMQEASIIDGRLRDFLQARGLPTDRRKLNDVGYHVAIESTSIGFMRTQYRLTLMRVEARDVFTVNVEINITP